jgi:hypothetical protein
MRSHRQPGAAKDWRAPEDGRVRHHQAPRASLDLGHTAHTDIIVRRRRLANDEGNRLPSGPACRLLELMSADKRRWLKILEQGISRKAS